MLRETDSLVFTGVTGTGFGSAISIPLRCVLGHPARDAPETLDCLLVPRIRAGGDPEKPLTGRSERRIGNSEDVGFGEQPLGERDRLLRNRAEVDERLRGRHRQLPLPFDRSHDDLPLARDVWPGRIEPTSVGECLQRHVTVGAQVTLYWWTAATTLAIASGTTAHPSRSPVKESWKERRGRDHRSDNPASVTLGVASRPGLGTAPRWFRPPTWRTRKKG